MSENYYGALMMRSALPTTQDLKAVTEPGIYPVITGNSTAPNSQPGTLHASLPSGSGKLRFIGDDGKTYEPTNTGWRTKGTAAFRNVGLSDGNVLEQGAWGLGKPANESAASTEHVGRFFYEPFQPGTLYPVSASIVQSGGPTSEEWGQLAISYGVDFRIFVGHGVYGKAAETTELFHDKRKPTNADVGSFPSTGGVLKGDLSAQGNVTSGSGKDISAGQDIWAGRDAYAQRNLSVTAGASVGLDLTVGRNVGVTGNIDAGGYIKSGPNHDLVSNQDIWATRNIFEQGVRLYGPNNPPPAKFSKALNTISWEKNLETGVIRQWGFVDVGDNGYVTVNLPIAFPSSFLALNVTPRVPGMVSALDVVSAGGQILTTSSFGVGVSANFSPNWTGIYFEAIGV